jgi:hypothetical protein
MKSYVPVIPIAAATFFFSSMNSAVTLPIRSAFIHRHNDGVVMIDCKLGTKKCGPKNGITPKFCNPCQMEGGGAFNGSGKGEQSAGPGDPVPVGGIPNHLTSPHPGTPSASVNSHR